MRLGNLIVTLLGLAGLCYPCVASATDLQFEVKTVTNPLGKKIDVRSYQLPEPPAFSQTPTLAQYHLISKLLEDFPPELVKVNVSCRINEDGRVELSLCGPESGRYDDPQIKLVRLLIFAGAPVLPEFEPVPSPSKFGRQITFPLAIDRSKLPVIDLTTGRAVPRSLISFTQQPRASYSSRALRAGAQGTLTMDCQVQSDYSIICAATHFDPPENLIYFEHHDDQWSQYGKVSEQLTDGSNSAGVRTTMNISFKASQ